MKTPHKHAELIKQWAEGAAIQRYNKTLQQWRDCDFAVLDWNPINDFRVKPEPKPDVVRYAVASKLEVKHVGPVNSNPYNNVMFVFDGETGELKDVQLLAKG